MIVIFRIIFEKKLRLARKLGVSNFFGVHFGCEPQTPLDSEGSRKLLGSYLFASALDSQGWGKLGVSNYSNYFLIYFFLR